jgi:hypothetical protein
MRYSPPHAYLASAEILRRVDLGDHPQEWIGLASRHAGA